MSLKGWELYSWKVGSGRFSYALLVGTNRLKNVEEVLNAAQSKEEVVRALSRLVRGDSVFWHEQGALRDKKLPLAFPPQEDITTVRRTCSSIGVLLYGAPLSSDSDYKFQLCQEILQRESEAAQRTINQWRAFANLPSGETCKHFWLPILYGDVPGQFQEFEKQGLIFLGGCIDPGQSWRCKKCGKAL